MTACHDTSFSLGRHMTVEFYDCDPSIIADSEKVKKAFLDAAKKKRGNCT